MAKRKALSYIVTRDQRFSRDDVIKNSDLGPACDQDLALCRVLEACSSFLGFQDTERGWWSYAEFTLATTGGLEDQIC